MIVAPVRFRMRDFVTFRVSGVEEGKRHIHECKDAKSETGYSLLTYVEATHAALVNGNMRFYRPDCMQESCYTWVDPKRQKKPVLVRHDEDCDPLGRIVTAKYIDQSYLYTGRYQEVKSLLFYDSTSSKRKDLFKSVDWVYDHLQRRNRDYSGLGYIQLGLNITNPDAIGKVQRGEYATSSVGFQTDAAICSVCHQNWSTDGKCEHRLGSIVDGKRCFLISGMFEYEECSFVNFPADPFAGVTATEIVSHAKDSMAMRVFLLGQTFDEEAGLFRMKDSITSECADMLEADIQVVTDHEDTEMELDAIRSEINSKELTKERALELRDQLEGNADAKRLLTTLKAKITKHGWNGEPVDALTKEAVEVRIATAPGQLQALAADERAGFLTQLEADATAVGIEVPSFEEAPPATVPAPAADALGGALETMLKDSKNGDRICRHLDSTRSLHDGMEDDNEKSLFRSAMGACMEVLSAEGWLSYMKGRVVQKDQMLVNRNEYDALAEGVEAYDAEKKTLTGSVAALKATNKSLIRDYKRALATTVVMYSVLSGETGFAGLGVDQIQAEIGDRSQRQLISLQDSLKDLQRKLSFADPAAAVEPTQEQTPGGTDAAAAPPAPEVAARAVDDNAQLQDSTEQPQDAATSDASQESPRGNGSHARPFATLEDLRSMRKKASVELYRSLKSKDSEKTE